MPSRGSLIRLTLLGILAVLAATVLMPLAQPRTERLSQPGPLVVVQLPTLRWADVDPARTPTLARLARDSALGSVSPWTGGTHGCSLSAWATVSTGFRAAVDATPERVPGRDPVPCPPVPAPVIEDGVARFPAFDRWYADLRGRPVPASLGTVGGVLAEHGQCVSAAGNGAALGAVLPDGTVPTWTPDPALVDLHRCPVTLVSLASVDDAALGALVDRLPAGTTLVVTGLTDDDSPEQLRAVLVHGPGVPRGALTSASSHHEGLLRIPDLSALAVSRVSPLPRSGFEGRIPVVVPRTDLADLQASLVDDGRRMQVQHDLVRPFFLVYVPLAVLLIGAVVGLLQHDRRRGLPIVRSRAGRALRVLGALTGALPVSCYLAGLVPWWRWEHPAAGLVASVLGWMVVVAVLALTGPWRGYRAGPAGIVAAVTMLVIGVDLVLGGELQLTTMLGLQPVHGGRLHGLGNVGFAVTASAALLAATLLTGRLSQRSASAAAQMIAALGVLTVVIDGHYALGDEAGGSLALVWGFGYLGLKARGRRITWRTLVGLTGLSALTGLVIATLDLLRPRYERSHIGDFLAAILAGGDVTTALRSTVVNNWQMLTSQWLNLGVPLLLLLAAWAARHPLSALGRPLSRLERHVPLLRPGFTALVLCWTVGFLTNDSGTSIPPAGMLLVAPLVLLMTACAPHPPADVPRGPAPAGAGPLGTGGGGGI